MRRAAIIVAATGLLAGVLAFAFALPQVAADAPPERATSAERAAAAGGGLSPPRYFRVTVRAFGGIRSDYVGNEHYQRYKGRQLFTWTFGTREIYEYREFKGSRSWQPMLRRACWSERRRPKTCAPTKFRGTLNEDVDLVENDFSGGERPLACTREATTFGWQRSKLLNEVLRFISANPPHSPFSLKADLRHVLPPYLRDTECWRGIGSHRPSAFESHWWDGDVAHSPGCHPNQLARDDALRWVAQNATAYEHFLLPPPRKGFRNPKTGGFRKNSNCDFELPLEHETYGGREHTTYWVHDWLINGRPLHPDKLKRAIKNHRNLN